MESMQWTAGAYLCGVIFSYVSSVEISCCVGFSNVYLQGDDVLGCSEMWDCVGR